MGRISVKLFLVTEVRFPGASANIDLWLAPLVNWEMFCTHDCLRKTSNLEVPPASSLRSWRYSVVVK